MIIEIKSGDRLIGFLLDHSDLKDGTHPVTDPSGALQILMMKRQAGHKFDKHTHEIMDRSSTILQEAIVVTKGKLVITVCDREGNDIGPYDVAIGQCLFLVDGGYGIEVVEDAEFFEFKNGPHTEDKILL